MACLVVEGQAIAPGSHLRHTVTDVSPGDNIIISLGDANEIAVYVLHCIHEDFPMVMTVLDSNPAATTELMSLVASRRRGAAHHYLMIINKDMVPLFYRRIANTDVRQFQYHPEGIYGSTQPSWDVGF